MFYRVVWLGVLLLGGIPLARARELPSNVRVVLDQTDVLVHPRGQRLPLYVLPISGALRSMGDAPVEQVLRELDRRGIGYSVNWQHDRFEESLAEGIRIARVQQSLGQPVAVNANACLYSFFDGSEETLHVDASGRRFADTSHGGKIGCPFSLEHRIPVIRERIAKFVRGYQRAGCPIDFIFADWEIDGPLEWNDAWEVCQTCVRCKQHMPDIADFRRFQGRLRRIRSRLMREAFAQVVTTAFPQALVGNYGTYPHNGYRYWYDYFEKPPADARVPVVRDGKAPYREWAHEFTESGFRFAMPVVYTWYPIFNWYDFEDTDYRWFYNMLKVASNAGRHTPQAIPLIPFVHHATTAPPKHPDPRVQPFSDEAYQELLWHMLLRGHDTFFLWCLSSELAHEVKLVHEVYAASLAYQEFLNRGTPINFEVPKSAGAVVSGLQLGERVLVRRTDFGEAAPREKTIALGEATLTVPVRAGLQVLEPVSSNSVRGHIQHRGRETFPIGFYEFPEGAAKAREMAAAGINLVRCGSVEALDRAQRAGLSGWMPLGLQDGATDAFRRQVQSVKGHPALAVWEGPDEIIWTFTAYSFLKERAGFTREDWNNQKKIAVDYANREAAKIIPAMRAAVAHLRLVDERQLPVWINEAADSDVHFGRQIVPFVDVTGCDYYAVRKTGTDLQSVGRLVDRWQAIGRNKPVWMVLQGFSWHSIKPERGKLYPSFEESRFMAYNSIVHGARGIFYWGTNMIDDPAFRGSLYALTSELSALQPFLTGSELPGVEARVIHDLFEAPGRGVRSRLLSSAGHALLVLVNEDNARHLGVDVGGLEKVEGMTFQLLYGEETATVRAGRLVTRMQPYEVKVFCTGGRQFASSRREGRDYVSP